MTDFRLKVFCSVARNLSFTKASREMDISQPAISKHIQELEQEYDTRLFDRGNNHIKLTPAGEALLVHAEQILERYKKLDSDMQLFSHEPVGELRLGASATIAQYVLPAYLAAYSAVFKQVKPTLLNGNTADVERAVEEQRIDLGLVEGRDRQPHLRYMPFMSDELVLVASTRRKWAFLERIAAEELTQLPLVVGEAGSDDMAVIEQMLSARHIELSELNIAMQLGSTEGIKRYIEHTDCMAIVSAQSVSQEIASGQLKAINIEGLAFERVFSFVQRIGETGGIAKDFIRYMVERQ